MVVSLLLDAVSNEGTNYFKKMGGLPTVLALVFSLFVVGSSLPTSLIAP